MKPVSRYELHPWHIAMTGIVLCVGLVALAYVTILQPIRREQGRINEMRSELNLRHREVVTTEAKRLSVEENLAAVQAELDARPVRLEPASHLNSRLAAIVDLASSGGLVIDQTSSGEADRGEWYDTVDIQLMGRGTFPNCVQFLRRLHDALPDVEAVTFDVTGNPAQRGGLPTFRFELSWFAAPTIASSSS